MVSINTNPGALIALQNLTQINSDLEQTQRRVSTGLEVSSAADNPAIFALAQRQRAELGSIESVQQGLRIGSSAVDVALAAGESISDILVEMRAIASQASDPSISAGELQVLEEQFVSQRQQIERLVDSAEIGGRNLLEAGATDLTVVANTDGSDTITVQAQDLSTSGGILTFSFADNPFVAIPDDPATVGVDESQAAASTPATEIAAIEQSIDNLSLSLARLGAGSQALTLQGDLLTKISDTLEVSIGNLVDADLARESSRLQALQVQQQLSIQTLSIANAAPNAILALFA
ncbi:MAG: flagellin [Pseudomonadota bacterium]